MKMEAPTPKSTKSRRRDTDDSRAERKRIQDRLAQRATRERTKNRIAYLEQRLSSLEAGDKDGEITNLTRIIDNLRNDNNRLRNALVKMRTVIDQAVLAPDSSSEAQPDTRPCGCNMQSACTCAQTPFPAATPATAFEDPNAAFRHTSVSSTDTSEVTEVINGHSLGLNVDVSQPDTMGSVTGLEDFFDFNPNSLLEMFEMGSTTGFNGWQPQTPSPFDYRFPSSDAVVKVAPDVDKWHVSNGAFISCLDSVKQHTASTATLDMHVPFKAAIWGWDNVGPEAQHPVWNALRQVDQRVFGTWTSKAQRIALMYVCQTLIQYRENPTRENLERVPVFLRPRPSQERVQHPAVIDFLIWPGLRDRLVFEHKKYTSTGDFSAAFVENFNFYWPYSDRDIFAYNPVQNRYEVSKIFLEYAYNFKNWTMKPGFFKKFPEMQHDIAAFEGTMDFPKASWST
ncbi:uncharacterized protein PV07_01338 [Cladophialophora immunda]|uniref:BZIP domain-containing protein n=1 Tax=Cladophialophora immunda TaxID=569365 RepID=A0A0D2A2P9_9EURO|nr:uncharacterized protein PV07_01338 [Cladophialophora immunda]KIW34561.1 hypothetical protein PV07_01338 [Cladophialophora immunda]OQV04493.1 hypothetical protein CLAIMM_09364 isoform 1 [Cladophialophora immunda]OQV04494.1 hypothetical protein CLAIMM_09364 isoform 2 [Cladophialophora immunda]